MKRIVSIVFILFSSLFIADHTANAQNDGQEQIKAAMISFYTDQMELTPEQAIKFWPIHNEYENERRKINREIRSLKKSGNPKDLEKIDQLEKKRFELRTKFKSRFLEVISPSQLSKMYKAEEDWRKIMLQRLNKD